MRKLPIVVTESAALSVQQAMAWWKSNRPKAPGAIEEELKKTFELIAFRPNAGTIPINPEFKNIRRIYLSRIRYYLYYRVRENPRKVEVLAFWHSSRGFGPKLETTSS